jgi:hypothetical protein
LFDPVPICPPGHGYSTIRSFFDEVCTREADAPGWYTRDVRIRRFVAAAIVAICIGVPLIEAFDSWDQTLRDGEDTEANLVVAALCVGFALSVVHTITSRIFGLVATRTPPVAAALFLAGIAILRLASPIPTGSPPVALRV